MTRPAFLRTVAVAAALAATAAVVAGAPAQAATSTTISLRTMGGDRQVTAAWARVGSATRYTVHWGPGSSTSRVLHTTGTTIRINGVSNFRSYSLRVTADGTSAASTRHTATPSPYSPTRITSVRAVPAGPNQIKVSWTGGGRARSIAVYVGSDSQTKSHHYATAWHPAALSSWTVTLPPSLRDVLGAGSGNVVFVRVVQTNSTAARPRMEWNFDGTTKFRLSDVGPWTIAGAVQRPIDATAITVASWNAQAISASAAFHPENRWDARLPKVVRNVENLHPDVIGFQELGTARERATCQNTRIHQGIIDCVEQYQTFEKAVASTSGSVPTAYRNAVPGANEFQYQDGVTTSFVDSSLFYNPARLDVIDSGFLSPRQFMGSHLPSSYPDEVGVWAVLRTKEAAPREFLMASIHMPAGGENVASVRRAEAVDLATALDAMAAARGGVPIVVTGDFNGDGVMDPNASNLRFVADGYSDAAATIHRSSPRWCTSNLTNGPDGVDPGYPVHAVPHIRWGSRIDYIMLKGAVSASYRNEVRLTAGGLFDPQYQGSDHNLQLATIRLVAQR